jgi:hypothetical protein
MPAGEQLLVVTIFKAAQSAVACWPQNFLDNKIVVGGQNAYEN